jgi:large subunit ribosomal protein L9
MQVILLDHVKGLGRKGDVVKVKDGYYLNFLQPKKLGVMANDAAIKRAKENKQKEVLEKEQIKEEARLVQSKLEGINLVLKGKAKGEKLYASITSKELIDAIFGQLKIRLEKTHFPPKLHLKNIGVTQVPLKLNEGVTAQLKVEIQAE